MEEWSRVDKVSNYLEGNFDAITFEAKQTLKMQKLLTLVIEWWSIRRIW